LKPRLLPYVAASVTGIQVGAALVASEAIVDDIGPAGLGFWRYLIASAVLIPFWITSKHVRVARHHIFPISLIGFGQFGVLIALLNVAVLLAASSRVSFVFATLPFATLAFERLIFHNRMGLKEVYAIVISFVGIAFLIGADLYAETIARSEGIGLLAALAATLTGAICSIFLRPYVRRYGAVQVSLLAMLASLIPLGMMASLETQGHLMANLSGLNTIIVVSIGLSSGIGFWCWLYALSHAPAGHVTAFLGLSPVTAVILSIAMDREPLTISVLAALLLVIGALSFLIFPSTANSRT